MTTEIQIDEEAPALDIETPPPAVTLPAKNGHKKAKADKVDGDELDDAVPSEKDEDREAKPKPQKLSRPLREVQLIEDTALRDWFVALGCEENSIRVAVSRLEPQTAVDRSGKLVKVNGHLENYNQFVDEAMLQERHGGGKFRLRVLRKDPIGKWQFFKHKEIDIAGDPRTDTITRNVGPEPTREVAAPATEAPSVVAKAMDMMERMTERQLKNAETHGPATPPDISATIDAYKMMVQSLTDQMAARDAEMAAMRGELAAARNYKPPEDPLKEKILGSLIDGESGRIAALRSTHESELRTIKANAIEDEKRLRDSFERDKSSIEAAHAREVQTMKSSHELALSMAKSSFETQVKILEQQVRSLERDNSDLRVEVKDLRAKKEKSVIEQVKDMKEIKEAFEVEETESTGVDKVLDVITNPDALKAVQGIIRGPAAAAPVAAVAAAQAQQQAKYQRQIVKTPDGQKFVLEADGTLRGPVKKKTAPGEVELPDVPADRVALAVRYLESSFTGGQDPDAVATSAKSLVPADVMNALRDVGPDVFMTKIAKLAQTSPLANQQGRNWVRKVAKSLLG